MILLTALIKIYQGRELPQRHQPGVKNKLIQQQSCVKSRGKYALLWLLMHIHKAVQCNKL